MDSDDIIIRDLGTRLAKVHGYPATGADALRFYLMHKATLPARAVLAMRPSELLDAYAALDGGMRQSRRVH
jgi:hypothetical protein